MVSIQDIKDFLIIDTVGQDALIIQKFIDRATSQVKDYCNNEFPDGIPLSIQDIIIQLVCAKYSPETRLKTGKSSQNMGQVSISYSAEIPPEFKSILNKYRRVKLL